MPCRTATKKRRLKRDLQSDEDDFDDEEPFETLGQPSFKPKPLKKGLDGLSMDMQQVIVLSQDYFGVFITSENFFPEMDVVRTTVPLIVEAVADKLHFRKSAWLPQLDVRESYCSLAENFHKDERVTKLVGFVLKILSVHF